jgi:predicted component of type VI protein secretion system
MFEVSLEGLGASAQDIEVLRRIRALIAGKSVPAQLEQETRPSSSQAQPSQHQDAVPPHTAPDSIDFNNRQAERYLTLLQSQIAGTPPPQQVAPTPPAPTPTPAAHAAPAAQQHAWHTLQAMQAQLDQWRQ